jgi:hypothetical protein
MREVARKPVTTNSPFEAIPKPLCKHAYVKDKLPRAMKSRANCWESNAALGLNFRGCGALKGVTQMTQMPQM